METDPAPIPPPASDATPVEDQPEQSTQKRRHTGFVGRKSHEVREKINLMILDGLPYRKIIENLGPDGQNLDEDNLSQWVKRGGYNEWYENFLRADALRGTREACLALLKENAGKPAQDAARSVAAVQLHELLLSFEPTKFAAALSEEPELYLGLVNALSRLCEADAETTRQRSQESLNAAKLTNAEKPAEKKLLTETELKNLAKEIKLI